MMEPLISIQLLNTRRRRYRPGDDIDAQYQIDAVMPEDMVAVEASILWYTEGKGEEDISAVFFERRTLTDAPEGDLRRLRRFQTRLPKSPLSYDGVILKIRWCMRVRVFMKGGKDFFLEQSFQVGDVPRAKAVVIKKRRAEQEDEDPFGDDDAH